ncbi:TonB-dependent receptor [Novosphingobium umbonatum]|uniref:TonB-dependent receptor n=1 Tax=Novosphingobium umbonatum TaxID=1908524 RepID=A0A437MX10_9SPHN|nr:TonB-dependent receptor [Novosphingobium umbonatum]RVU02177.1 TonB-dependent receptor [Novosphingobium umbonatum]
MANGRRAFVFMASASAFVWSGAAFAQSEGSSNGEIIVTASRTASLASKTPITLTAVTADKLTSQGVTNPTQLMDVVPNLTIDRGNANGLQINIRGITSTGTASQSAAFLLDGIYIQQQNAQEVAFYDLARVEVLRGPQGTLYGRNTTAGVVNVITAEPKPTFGTSIEGGYGAYNARTVTVVVNAPVTNTLALRLAGNYEARDSYYHQTVAQSYKNPLDKDNKSVRLTALWKPSDAIKWLVKLDYTRMNGAGSGFGMSPLISNFYAVPLKVPAAGQRSADPVYLNPSADAALAKTYANTAPFSTNDSTWSATSNLDWRLGKDWTLTVLTGYREFRRDDTGSVFWGADYSGTTPVFTTNAAATSQVSHSNSEEVRLAYDNGKLKAQAGFYHFYNHDSTMLSFGNFGLPTPSASQESLGVFGQTTYALNDRWRVTGGLRYTRDHLASRSQAELLLPTGPFVLNDTSVAGHSSKVTWKFGSDFDITSHVMGYVTVATGYKAIGFNRNCSSSAPGCQYKPETLTNFEGGVKARLMGNKLYVTADYFHYNYNDLQISQIISQVINGVNTPSSLTTNAAKAQVDGLEFEGNFAPSTGHNIDFSLAWLNARYSNYAVAQVAGSGNYNNSRLDHAPTWALSGGYTYRHPLASGATLEAGIHARYTTAHYIINSSVNAQFVQPAFHKTDIRLRYTAPSERWYLEAYAKNLENKVDVTYINTAPAWPTLNNGTVSTGDPRTYGVRAALKL